MWRNRTSLRRLAIKRDNSRPATPQQLPLNAVAASLLFRPKQVFAVEHCTAATQCCFPLMRVFVSPDFDLRDHWFFSPYAVINCHASPYWL